MPKNLFSLSPTKSVKFVINPPADKSPTDKSLSFSDQFLKLPSPRLRRSSSPKPRYKKKEFHVESYHTICVGNSNDFSTKIGGSQAHHWISLESSIVDLFNNCENALLPTSSLAQLHKHVSKLLDSSIGSFVYDRFKSQMLSPGMQILLNKIKSQENLIQAFVQIWQCFFYNVLPLLDCILYRVKPKNELTIRQTSLLSFRNEVLLKTNFEYELKEMNSNKQNVPFEIKHMLLTLQHVNESFPPSKNKLKLETLTSTVVNPFLGYEGLFFNSALVIPSKEPSMNATRKKSDPGIRRNLRPISIHSKQPETLHQLFISAIRKN